MSQPYKKGDRLEWDWGGGTGNGKVTEVFTADVTRTISGSQIKRKASDDCPAYLLEQEDGARVLKSHSEVRKHA